jgi:hypothetical protein
MSANAIRFRCIKIHFHIHVSLATFIKSLVNTFYVKISEIVTNHYQ